MNEDDPFTEQSLDEGKNLETDDQFNHLQNMLFPYKGGIVWNFPNEDDT